MGLLDAVPGTHGKAWRSHNALCTLPEEIISYISSPHLANKDTGPRGWLACSGALSSERAGLWTKQQSDLQVPNHKCDTILPLRVLVLGAQLSLSMLQKRRGWDPKPCMLNQSLAAHTQSTQPATWSLFMIVLGALGKYYLFFIQVLWVMTFYVKHLAQLHHCKLSHNFIQEECLWFPY